MVTLFERDDVVKVRARAKLYNEQLELTVEHVAPCPRADSGAVAIPIEALADFEGRDETPVAVDQAGPRTVRARWADRGVPASRKYEAGDVGALPVFPAAPESWHESSPAVAEASASASRSADDASCHDPGGPGKSAGAAMSGTS